MNDQVKRLFEAVRREADLTSEQRISEIESLVASGVDVNSRREYGLSVLWDAVASPARTSLPTADLDVIECLLRLGADSNAQGDIGCRPLDNAISANDTDSSEIVARSIEVVRLLQSHGATPGKGKGLWSYSCSHRSIFELMLEVFPDTRTTNEVGNSPLHRVVSTQRPILVEFLLGLTGNQAVDVNAVNDMGKTPLGLAYTGDQYSQEQKAKRNRIIGLLEAKNALKKVTLSKSEHTTPFDAHAVNVSLESVGDADRSVKRFFANDFDTYQELISRLPSHLQQPEQSVPAIHICQLALGPDLATTKTLQGDQKFRTVFFHHGDLVVEGHLAIVCPFAVTGDLTVLGCITDCGPDSMVIVGGDVTLDSLNTSGEFHVGGDITAKNVVHGYYNDNVLAASKICARLVIEDEHATAAEVDAVTHFDSGRYQQGYGDGVQEELRRLLVAEVFQVEDGESRFSYELLFSRLRNGMAVFR